MKLINMDTGTGRVITRADEARIEAAIHVGDICIDLTESRDCDGDICLDDGDYLAAVGVLNGQPEI